MWENKSQKGTETYKMIKNIIFDIGNVLSDFRWRDFIIEKGFDQEMADRIGAASVKSALWSELDRGVWTDEQLLEGFVKNDPEIELQIREAFSDLHGMVVPREYAVSWVRELKRKGYRVYYLSNYSRRAREQCSDVLEFTAYTDGGILSYKERLVKPDPAIYHLLMKRYGLKAKESVFLDDTLENIETARRIGMQGIWFQSREQAVEELKKLGVE